jgi:hypothetical protein
MTDLRKLLDIVNDNSKLQRDIELYDSFDLELDEETILETGVVGLSDGAILLEMDEKGIQLLESKGIKLENPDFKDPKVRKFYDIPTVKRVQRGLSEPTDTTDYETPPSMRDPTRGQPGWVKRKHRLQQMGALPKDDKLTEAIIENVCEAHIPIEKILSKRGLEILFSGMQTIWTRYNGPKNDEEFLDFAEMYVLLFLARDIVKELEERNFTNKQMVQLLEKEPILVRMRDQIIPKLLPFWHDYHWKDNPLKEGDVVSGSWKYSGESANIRDVFKMFVNSKFYKGPIKDDKGAYTVVSDVKEFLKDLKMRMPRFKFSGNYTDDEIALAVAMFLYQVGTDLDPLTLKESSHKKVYKMQGEPIGEIGKNSDGEYYVKHYLSGIDNTGYASKSEAVKDLKAMQHSVADNISETAKDYKALKIDRQIPGKVQTMLDTISELRLQAKLAKDREQWSAVTELNDKIENIEDVIVSKYDGQRFIDYYYKTLGKKEMHESKSENKKFVESVDKETRNHYKGQYDSSEASHKVKEFVPVIFPDQYAYNKAMKFARDYFEKYGANGYETFSSPSYGGLPREVINRLSKEDILLIQEIWPKQNLDEAKYQGRTVSLGKPFMTPDGPKKRSVYVKNPKGNIVKVNFGDKKMRIKKSNPKNRKSFRARHKCSNPGPRWKARYWSCRQW